MSIYPNVWDVEPTHFVRFRDTGEPPFYAYYTIWKVEAGSPSDGDPISPGLIKGEKVASGAVPPDELMEGALFNNGYQVIGTIDSYNEQFPSAFLRPMPELLVSVVRARRKLLVSQGSETAKTEMRDAIAALLDSGVSEYAAAEMLGVTRMTVRNWRNPS